ESWPRLRQTEEDFFQAERIPGSGSGEIVYKADGIKWIEVFSFSEGVDSIDLLYTTNGISWKPLPEGTLIKMHRPAYESQYSRDKYNSIDKYVYQVPAMPNGTIAVKIQTGNGGANNSFPWIGRVHIGFTGSIITERN